MDLDTFLSIMIISLLADIFRQFTFNTIIDIVRFKSIILIFVFYLADLFLFISLYISAFLLKFYLNLFITHNKFCSFVRYVPKSGTDTMFGPNIS